MPLLEDLACGSQKALPGFSLPQAAPHSKAERQLNGAHESRWCLHMENRGRKPARDWVMETGIYVVDALGVTEPINRYLYKQVKAFATAISMQPVRTEASLVALWSRTIKEVGAVVNSSMDFPDEYWAYATCSMLMGNFCDAILAILDIALGNDEPGVMLDVDAHTIAVVKPEYYARIKGEPGIDGAVPMRSRFALACVPNSTVAGDEGVAPRSFWALQNALNFEFQTKASKDKRDYVKAWDDQLAERFRRECMSGDAEGGFITPDELEAYLRQT